MQRSSERRPRSAVLGARATRRGFQIGPRIRIGGTVGKIGQNIKIGLGKTEKAIAPFASLIPGVGAIAAPILNTAGNLFDTSNGGVHLNNLPRIALQDAGLYGVGKLASGVAGKLMGGAAGAATQQGDTTDDSNPMAPYSEFPGGVDPSTYDPSNPMAPYSEFPNGQPPDSGDGGFMDWAKSKLGQAGSALFGSGGQGQGNSSLFDKLLLGGSVAASASDQAYKKGLIDKGIGAATDAYNANAPLRTQGRTLLQNRTTPDLSSIFANPGDPYARRAPTSPPALS
jgi:hypothetical protein